MVGWDTENSESMEMPTTISQSLSKSKVYYLSRKKIAIVSREAGTTRDILNQKVSIKGIPVTFYDTAGLRKSKNNIELEAKIRCLL